MKRVLLLAAVCLLLCTACRPRVALPLSEEPAPTTAAPTLPTEPGEEGDEMAAYAWEVYSAALDREEQFNSYDLTYESREYALGQSTVGRARILRKEEGDSLRLLLTKTRDKQTSTGYYENGVGYFDIDGQKYWMPTDEDGFFSEFGFSESDTLTREMFADAIVAPAEGGGLTVSCPLPEPYASAYAEEMMGVGRGVQTRRVEMDLTVDADGAPLEFLTTVTLWVPQYGEVTYESMNRYEQVGEEVQITPPEGLDAYEEK